MTGTTPQQFANLVDRAIRTIREGITCRRDRIPARRQCQANRR